MASLKERIKQLRNEKNMTGEQLGSLLNVSKQSISKWEHGNATPDIETIKKMTKIFDTSLDYICGISDIRNPYQNIEKEEVSNIALWLSTADGYKDLPAEEKELISNIANSIREKYKKRE